MNKGRMTFKNFFGPTIGFIVGLVIGKYLLNLTWSTTFERIFFGVIAVACVAVSYIINYVADATRAPSVCPSIAALVEVAEVELDELSRREYALSCAEDGYPLELKKLRKRIEKLRAAIVVAKTNNKINWRNLWTK